MSDYDDADFAKPIEFDETDGSIGCLRAILKVAIGVMVGIWLGWYFFGA